MRTNRERVTMALDMLVAGLAPFAERHLKSTYGDRWQRQAQTSFRDNRGRNPGDSEIHWDAHSLLTVMWDQWNRAFREVMSHQERSLVSELREYRNQWAHQLDFSYDDTYRMLDSIERLLRGANAPLAKRVRREKQDLMRSQFTAEAKAAYRRSQLRKRTWQDLAIYLVCCAALVVVTLQFFGIVAWVAVGFIMFVFGYLSYQRLQSQPPLIFGPHECGACRRIIYGADCPYCEKAGGSETATFTAAAHWFQESPDAAEDAPPTEREAANAGQTPSKQAAPRRK